MALQFLVESKSLIDKATGMNWYLAKIVYRIVCGSGEHTAQFDEQLRLIHAANYLDAMQKALLIGESEAEVFVNNDKQLVQWKFINVSELHQVSMLIDGAELYSRISETNEPEEFTRVVHLKATHILETYQSEMS